MAWRSDVLSSHDGAMRFLALEDPSIDVIRMDNPWVPEFADPGWLLPLDDRIPASELDSLVPSARASGTWRGQTWALPIGWNANVLYLRTDWMAEAGLEPPTSLYELGEQASALRRAHGIEAGLAMHGILVYNDVLPMLWASGGAVLGPEGSVEIDEGPNLEVVRTLAGWIGTHADAPVPRPLYEGAWSDDYRAPMHTFQDGQAAFLLTWASRHALIDAPGTAVHGRVGVAPIPGLDEGSQGSNLGTWTLGVSRFSDVPDEAVAFTRWLTSPEVQRERLERLGTLPATAALYTDPDLVAAHPELEAFRPLLANARTRPRVPNEREVGVVLEEAFQEVFREGADPAPTLARAAEQLEVRRPAQPGSLEPPMSDPWWSESPTQPDRPALLGLAIAALLALTGGAILWLQSTGRVRRFRSLAWRLAGLGIALVAGLASISTGFSARQLLISQQRDLAQAVGFYRERMTDEARTLGKQLALSASLLAELDPDDPGAAVDGLRMTSHFTEGLLFVELLDPDGEPLEGGDRIDGLDPGVRYPRQPDHVERIRQRAIAVGQVEDAEGEAYVEVHVPVFRHGIQLGALRLGASEARYRAEVTELRDRHDAELDALLRSAALNAALLIGMGTLIVVLVTRWLTRPIAALTAAADRVRQGDLDVVFEPGGNDEIGELTRTMAEMVQGLRDRDYVRDLFGRYVTPELAEQALSDPDALELGGQLTELTVLLSDLRGFTALSETLGPEQMVALLNRYLAQMTDVILAHGGTVNEFIGDAILVLFGAPVSQPDHALRSVRCAVAMQRAMIAFNAENEARGLPFLEMGIGVATGQVIAGNIGGERRVKYGVVGPTVNLAGRIEALTVGGQILVAEETHRRVAEHVRVPAPLQVQMKGQAKPVAVFELLTVDGVEVPQTEVHPVPADLPARFRLLVGKHVEGSAHEARVDALATDRLWLRTAPGSLAPLDNLLLTLTWPAGESEPLYAKVRRVEDDRVEAHLTALDPVDRERLDRWLTA